MQHKNISKNIPDLWAGILLFMMLIIFVGGMVCHFNAINNTAYEQGYIKNIEPDNSNRLIKNP